MRVTFWGTRGSLPTPLGAAAVRRKVIAALVRGHGHDLDNEDKATAFVDTLDFPDRATFGGNSACVEISTGTDEFLICDQGSGAREFGLSALGRRAGKPGVYHVLMSHVHWDHIMGFPFLIPAYIPGNKIRIYGCHAVLEEAFRRQQSAPNFPVDFDRLGASIEFVRLETGRVYDIAGCQVSAIAQMHENDSYGYRIERGGRALVYSTDSEHKLDDRLETERFATFFHAADLVVFDAQYSLAEAVSVKEDWGHSSNVIGVELCQLAGARQLALFHHEPTFDDHRLWTLLQETRRFEEITRGDGAPLHVIAAYDGLVVEL